MYNASHWYKIMEQLQIGNMLLNTCIDFILQKELIQKYSQDKSQPSEQIFADTYILKQIKDIRIGGCEPEIKREKCPAFGKTCKNCSKKNHFQAVCKFKKKNVERVEKKKRNQYGSLFSKKEKCRKNWTEKKDIILEVKIDDFDLDMQMDSEVTLIIRKFWEPSGKPTFRKSKILFRQFDGSVIKTLGYFEGPLVFEDKFEVIPIIVTIVKRTTDFLETMCFT